MESIVDLRKHLMLIIAIPIVALSIVASFALRFDFALPSSEFPGLYSGLAIFIAAKVPVYYLFERRRRLWSYVGLPDLLGVLAANVTASAGAWAATWFIIEPPFPKSVYLIDMMICFILTGGLVFSRRLLHELISRRAPRADSTKAVLIYGAGAAGLTLAKEIQNNQKICTRVVGFLDDDSSKTGASLTGIRVLGPGRAAAQIVRHYSRRSSPISEIIVAMPSANQRDMREVIANCRAAGVPFKTVPSLAELLEGKVLTGQIREVSVNDLLGRDAVRVSDEAIGEHVTGKVVLVTGGCGSIGSELCRQLARFSPRCLVIFDQAESEMFMLALELRDRFPALELVTEIGDIVSYPRLNDAMRRNGVEAVFHAAAYKHVPLMEAHILEAAKNNVIGTYNVVSAAYENHVQRFLMISSDKAVNPTSIMGVTKRIGEILVSAMPLAGGPALGKYLSVRFGNVLASNGSVVQIFKRQIAAGGPVTVTHPEMRRYFMSIPEAVQLVLQAFAMGNGGEVFVLDMGQPVRISELAHNMIRLAGFIPGEDINIQYTGLRAGEKLFEEINTASENMLPTYHEKIRIFRSPLEAPEDLAAWVADLQTLTRTGDAERVKSHLLELVPEYLGAKPSGKVARIYERPAEDVCA
jgi:Predicted nucleoside-diphosphate sugar epimerases